MATSNKFYVSFLVLTLLLAGLSSCSSEEPPIESEVKAAPQVSLNYDTIPNQNGPDTVLATLNIKQNPEEGTRLIRIFIEDDLKGIYPDAGSVEYATILFSSVDSLLEHTEVRQGLEWARAIESTYEEKGFGVVDYISCNPAYKLPNGSSPCSTYTLGQEEAHQFECSGDSCIVPEWSVSLMESEPRGSTEVTFSKDNSSVQFIVKETIADYQTLRLFDYQTFKDHPELSEILDAGQRSLIVHFLKFGEQAKISVCSSMGDERGTFCQTYSENGDTKWICGPITCKEFGQGGSYGRREAVS